MSLMGDEVGQDMADVERQVAPDVPLGRRHMSRGDKAQPEKILNPLAAPFQCSNELPASNATLIDPIRSGNAVLPPERFDPSASHVVKVGGDHSNRAMWLSRDRDVPEPGRQVLDEGDSDPVVRSPCRN